MRTRRLFSVTGGALALAVVIVPGAQAARPDLRVTSVSQPPALAAAGSSVRVRVKVSNTGRGSARRSKTFVLLSRDARRSKDDIRVARVPTRRLVAGHRTRVRRGVRIPATVAAGIWRMLVCADGPRRVHETRERNNCRKARRALVVRAKQPTPATTPTPAPSPTPAPTPGSGSPKCATEDRPDMAFVDANCDGVDGVAADAVFVSATTGSDGAPGTRDKPRRHLTDAVALAVKTGRSSVLAATGDYAGTLVVAPGVSVYGGYDPVTWKRSKAAETVIEGANDATGSFGVKAQDAVAATTLQLLHVKSPTPATSSGSAYGVDAVHSPGLRLENLIVEAGNATGGENGQNGGDGLPGTKGSDGAPGKCDTAIGGAGGAGGGSPAGYFGGAGGAGGSTGNGASGITGLVLGGAGASAARSGTPASTGMTARTDRPARPA
jgi:CARDB